MSWTFGPYSAAKVASVLEKEDSKIETILDDSSFNQIIRSPTPSLTKFLERPGIMKTLYEFVFAELRPSSPNKAKTVRSALQLFTAASANLSHFLYHNAELVSLLQNFPNTEFIHNPRICGHFQRVIESFARNSAGAFIRDNPYIHDFLINNIHMLSLKDLYVFLVSEHRNAFGYDEAKAEMLIDKINGESAYEAILALKTIIRTKSDTIPLFSTEAAIEKLIKVANDPSIRPLVAIETFHVLSLLPKNVDIMAKYPFDWTVTNKSIVAAALNFYQAAPDDIVMKLFENSPYSFLNESIINFLSKLDGPQLSEFITKHNLLDLVIETAKATKTNAHVFQLAELFEATSPRMEVLDNEAWTEWVNTGLKEHITARDSSYGGEKPKPMNQFGKDSGNEDGDYGDTAPCEDVDSSELFNDSDSDSDSDSDDLGSSDDDDFRDLREDGFRFNKDVDDNMSPEEDESSETSSDDDDDDSRFSFDHGRRAFDNDNSDEDEEEDNNWEHFKI